MLGHKLININDIKDEIDKIENDIKEKWIDTKTKWSNVATNHISYNKYLRNQIEKLNIEENRLKKSIEGISLEIKLYEKSKDELAKKENKLAQKYGMFVMSFPKKLLEELNDKDISILEEKTSKIEADLIKLDNSWLDNIIEDISVTEVQENLHKYNDEARDRWANRAAIHGIKMVNALKEMVSSVVYLNERGYSFPLVKLKGEELLPKHEDEIIIPLRDYFIQCIEGLLKEYDDIDNIEDGTIEKLMNDNTIFSKTVGGRYPKLMVYKMTEKNEFKYAKPREHYYESWEAINKGEGVMTEGSGGQTLSISTFVIMMLMNYKKRYIGNNNPWTVLMIDNIFGKASGKHVLDPIFEIANQLNFQLLAFAAPEIIKAEISERFPVFWALSIADSNDDTAGSVKGKVIHGGRVMG